MRFLSLQVRPSNPLASVANITRYPSVSTSRIFMPLDLNDIDNYSHIVFSRFVRIST